MVKKEGKKISLERPTGGRHAISEGYPIPQWRRAVKWYLGSSPNAPFSEDMYGLVNHAYSAEEHRFEDDILIADRYQVLLIDRKYNCKFRFGKKNESVYGDGAHGIATFNHTLGDEGRILWSLRGEGRVMEIDVATGDVTLDWNLGGMPKATYEYGDQHPPTPDYTGNILVSDARGDWIRKYDREQNILYEKTLPNPSFIGGDGRTCLSGHDINIETLDDLSKTGRGQAWPKCNSHDWMGMSAYVMSGAWGTLYQDGDGGRGMIPHGADARATLTPYQTVLLGLHDTIVEYDMRARQAFRGQQVSPARFYEKSIDANTETDKGFVPLFNCGAFKQFAHSTEDATLKVYVVLQRFDQPTYCSVTDDNWPETKLLTTKSISAGETVQFIPSSPTGVYAFSIEMGGTAGEASMWGWWDPR